MHTSKHKSLRYFRAKLLTMRTTVYVVCCLLAVWNCALVGASDTRHEVQKVRGVLSEWMRDRYIKFCRQILTVYPYSSYILIEATYINPVLYVLVSLLYYTATGNCYCYSSTAAYNSTTASEVKTIYTWIRTNTRACVLQLCPTYTSLCM